MLPTQTKRYRYFEKDFFEERKAEVIVEKPVSLTVNGKVWLTFMCTPVQLEELAVGFLYNEYFIQSMDEVEQVHVCESKDLVDIWLTHSVDQPESWKRTTGCTGGVTAAGNNNRQTIKISTEIDVIQAAQINRLGLRLFEKQEIYHEAGGVHISALSDGNKIILATEDIGHQNTLDKISGLYLMQKPSMEQKILLTSGRIGSEMLQKASRLGASILVSRTSPSSLSVEIADELGITLIGYARGNRFNIYTHPQRIFELSPIPKSSTEDI
jgi:FdhD protein